MVADNDGGVFVEIFLANDLVGDTTGSSGKDAKDTGDDIVDDVTLIDESTGD